jgi:hypothetical protein
MVSAMKKVLIAKAFAIHTNKPDPFPGNPEKLDTNKLSKIDVYDRVYVNV